MHEFILFFYDILTELFAFLAECSLFYGISLLQFIVAFIFLFIIIDNFILKPAKGSSGSFKVSKKSSKGGK